MIIPFFQGFGIGAGLIIAIGAQNSYVLSQGIKRQHIFFIPLICSLCDIVLIAAGAAGIGTFVAAHPQLSYYSGIGGALFLFWYGCKALRSAFRQTSLATEITAQGSLRSVLLTTLALSLLNPHVYLDTIVMLGAISGGYEVAERVYFTTGACCASIIWFYGLSLCGTLLEPLFRRPLSWKILDISMCIVMWSIAFSIWPDMKGPA